MNIVRSWREQKVMLKERFPFLKDKDFVFKEGNRDKMLNHLSARLKKTRSELELLFAELQGY